MRALVFHPPGGHEKLSYTADFQTLNRHDLRPGEVLIKVAAAGLIHTEIFWPVFEAKDGTWPARILCPDYSGTILEVAEGVSDFHIDDEVIAVSSELDSALGIRKYQGGAAEFAIAPVSAVMCKPNNISLQEAASIPLCALTAWQALHEQAHKRVVHGAEVLIAGAAGATGLWAVQVAKLMGARVTVSASDAKGIAILKNLGADQILNYRQQEVQSCGRKFDVVLDLVGGQVFHQCTNVVKLARDGGILISLVEFEARLHAPAEVESKFFIWRMVQEDLAAILKLIEAGRLMPMVDTFFPLHEGVEACVYAAKGHCHGKVVLTV